MNHESLKNQSYLLVKNSQKNSVKFLPLGFVVFAFAENNRTETESHKLSSRQSSANVHKTLQKTPKNYIRIQTWQRLFQNQNKLSTSSTVPGILSLSISVREFKVLGQSCGFIGLNLATLALLALQILPTPQLLSPYANFTLKTRRGLCINLVQKCATKCTMHPS